MRAHGGYLNSLWTLGEIISILMTEDGFLCCVLPVTSTAPVHSQYSTHTSGRKKDTDVGFEPAGQTGLPVGKARPPSCSLLHVD